MLERCDVPLAPLTTLRLGGPAHRLLTAYDEPEVVAAVREAQGSLVLAGGSNVVLPDAGLDTVVLVRSHGLSGRREGDRVLLEVAAGEDWDGLVAGCVADGLVGLETLSGIPGSVGASPVQNIGAYGADVARTVVAVRALDTINDAVVTLDAKECGFSYRHSAFKAEPGRWVVLSVLFALGADGVGRPVQYAELARALGVPLGDSAPVGEVREAVLALRRGKGMVVDSADPDSRSVGSFFTNPLLSAAAAQDLRARAPSVPTWPETEGRTKVSAAWLIEQAGFRKGHGSGPVGLSTKHTLALVHRGGGRTTDLLAVAREVRDGVRSAFGVELVAEPVLVNATL